MLLAVVQVSQTLQDNVTLTSKFRSIYFADEKLFQLGKVCKFSEPKVENSRWVACAHVLLQPEYVYNFEHHLKVIS